MHNYVCVSLLFLWSDQCHFFVKAPLTRTDTLTLAGSLKIKNGNGTGSVSLSERRILSHKAWGEVSLHCLILTRGTLRSYDATAMRMSKKTIGLITKTTTLQVHTFFVYFSLPFLEDYNVKMPNKQWWNYISFSKLAYGPMELDFRRVRVHLTM